MFSKKQSVEIDQTSGTTCTTFACYPENPTRMDPYRMIAIVREQQRVNVRMRIVNLLGR